MARKIDWLYHRRGCTSCQKARRFLEAHSLEFSSDTDARKDRTYPDEALQLARGADRVIVARGNNVQTFDMKKAPPDDAMLLAHLLGRTGTLRAPTLRKGKTLLVGFNDEAYRQVLTE